MRIRRGKWQSESRNRSALNAEGTGGVVTTSKPYMGQIGTAHVDVPALLDAARQYQAIAESLDDAIHRQLTGLAFDGASAGREYVARGDALRAGVDHLADQLRSWSRACVEIAAQLRGSAERYADVDTQAGDRVG
jgi:hypothetical protein